MVCRLGDRGALVVLKGFGSRGQRRSCWTW